MEFAIGRPDMIRAINQRWLHNFWKRGLGTDRLPRWQSVETEDLSRLSTHLSFLDVVGDGDAARYRVRFNGTMVSKVYGAGDCRGKFIDEILPMNHCPTAMLSFRRATENACPVYTIHDVTDRSGRLVHYERLLLPFGSEGGNVDRILASFEFICPDGAYDSDELLQMRSGSPALRLSALIEPRVG